MDTESERAMITSNRVLIVDSDTVSRQKWSRMLEIMGLVVNQAGSAEEALAQLELVEADLTFFDLPLPDMSDPELLRRARQMSPSMIIIIRSGRPTIESTVAAIKVGATDYLIGLIDSKQVVDTITGALRDRAREQERRKELLSHQVESYLASSRLYQGAPNDSMPSDRQLIAYAQYRLDRQSRQFEVEGEADTTIELTKGEVDILAALMSQPGTAMTCHEIVRSAFRYDAPEHEAQSVVRPYISRLRRKLHDAGLDRQLISTVRGRGYMFVNGC
ncbi:MAG: response regulator transcription factor [Chloroflexota bacterium]|nr:MAG: response regulator transcription factor [Chloroflexota bacterium]